jgi:hypothetical protein
MGNHVEAWIALSETVTRAATGRVTNPDGRKKPDRRQHGSTARSSRDDDAVGGDRLLRLLIQHHENRVEKTLSSFRAGNLTTSPR